MPKTLPARKALTARKGHAASVRRQSRQRLRSERRYRPRRGHYHFNGSPVRIGSTQQGVEDTAPTKGRARPINVRFLL